MIRVYIIIIIFVICILLYIYYLKHEIFIKVFNHYKFYIMQNFTKVSLYIKKNIKNMTLDNLVEYNQLVLNYLHESNLGLYLRKYTFLNYLYTFLLFLLNNFKAILKIIKNQKKNKTNDANKDDKNKSNKDDKNDKNDSENSGTFKD